RLFAVGTNGLIETWTIGMDGKAEPKPVQQIPIPGNVWIKGAFFAPGGRALITIEKGSFPGELKTRTILPGGKLREKAAQSLPAQGGGRDALLIPDLGALVSVAVDGAIERRLLPPPGKELRPSPRDLSRV